MLGRMRAALQHQARRTCGPASSSHPNSPTINPLLKVPAIVDSDGPGGKPYTVIESGAILIYLAEKTGKFIPHEPVARYETLQMGDLAGRQCRTDERPARAFQQVRRPRQRLQRQALSHAGAQAVRCLRTAADSAALTSPATTTPSPISRRAPWLRNFELLAIDPGQYPTDEDVGGQDRGA